jgi:hypothetical protein
MKFNKTNLLIHLENQTEGLEKTFKFDPHNGTSQIKDGDIFKSYAFGQYVALKELIEEIEDGL